MTRPSIALAEAAAVLARTEDRLARLSHTLRGHLRLRPERALEFALFLGICAEIWIGVVRSAALYTTP